MAIKYEWYKSLNRGEDIHYFNSEKLDDACQLDDTVGLIRFSDDGTAYAYLNKKKGNSFFSLSNEFDEGFKVPQRFHKMICELQGITYTKPVKKTVTKPAIPQERKDYVLCIAKQCIKELNKTQYELGVSLTVPNIKFHQGKRSTGGINGLNIGVRYFNYGWEYKRYQQNPIIGQVTKASQNTYLAMIVAHEIAHYVHHSKRNTLSRLSKLDNKPHGYAFQMIYRYLRETIINPMVKKDGGFIGQAPALDELPTNWLLFEIKKRQNIMKKLPATSNAWEEISKELAPYFSEMADRQKYDRL